MASCPKLTISFCRILSSLEIAGHGLRANVTKELAVCHDPVKGRGVVAAQKIGKGEFTCEYKYSRWYPARERMAAEEEHELNDEGSYILEVLAGGKKVCLDATCNIESWGRLINHAAHCKANLKMHPPLYIRGKWRVAFLAMQDIQPGEELCYDYGQWTGMPEWMRRKVIQ